MNRFLKLVGTAAVLAAGSVISGCAAPAIIADIAEDKVVVQGNQNTPQSEITAEAERGCGLYNRRAEPISKRYGGNPYSPNVFYLFACKPAGTLSPTNPAPAS